MKLREESFLGKRCIPEVFVSIVSLCDSKTMAASLAVNKLWRNRILESKAVFRHFEMVGNVAEIIKGIEVFGERSNHSLQSIDIKIKDSPTPSQKEQLRTFLSRSFETIKHLSIGHSRKKEAHEGNGLEEDLSQLIIDVAASCSNLLSLESFRMGDEDIFFCSTSDISVEVPSTFRAKMQTFVWKAGGKDLVYNETLARSLENAREVTICSSSIQPSWIIKRLLSNPSLVEVRIPWMSPHLAEDVPLLNLPKLKHLWLNGSLSSATGDGRLFWGKLRAPSLNYLGFLKLNPKELSSFQAPVSSNFCLASSGIDFQTQSGEEAAFSLVESMKSWNTLTRLTLELPTSTPSTFWLRLIHLLTPFHQESYAAGFEDGLILPNLQHLILGAKGQSYTFQLSLAALKSLVAARFSLSRGMSRADVSLSALSGEIQTSAQINANGTTVDGTEALRSLTIDLPVANLKAEDKEWFKSNGTNFISKVNLT